MHKDRKFRRAAARAADRWRGVAYVFPFLFLCSIWFHIHFPCIALKMDRLPSPAVTPPLLLLLIRTSKYQKQKLLKNSAFATKTAGSGKAQCSTQRKPVNIHSTGVHKELEPGNGAFHTHTHGCSHHLNYLWWQVRRASISVVCLRIGPSGWAVPHGSEKNLPETETHIQVCDGENTLGVNDVQLLWMHAGWLWMVSSLFFSSFLFFFASLVIINNPPFALKADDERITPAVCFHTLVFHAVSDRQWWRQDGKWLILSLCILKLSAYANFH